MCIVAERRDRMALITLLDLF